MVEILRIGTLAHNIQHLVHMEKKFNNHTSNILQILLLDLKRIEMILQHYFRDLLIKWMMHK